MSISNNVPTAVARVLDASWTRTCVALVLAAAAPVRRRARTPDPALSHWHARPPATRRAAAAGYPLACRPARYPAARPGMTHRDGQSMH